MILTNNTLLKNPAQITWFLANDENPPYNSDIHQSIYLRSIASFVVFMGISMLLQRNFGSFPNVSSIIISLGVPVALAFAFRFFSEREYRGKAVTKMFQMIPEYDHWVENDKRALRSAFLALQNDNDRVTDYSTQLRATYLNIKLKQTQKIEEINSTISKIN